MEVEVVDHFRCTNMWFFAIAILLVFLLLKFTKLKHWQEKGVPYIEPWPIVGNMGALLSQKKSFPQLLTDLYQHYPNSRYVGIYQFNTPTLMIRDPELIRDICVKDFDSFADHSDFLPASSDPFWKNTLFGREGKKWHDMRTVLSPSFTSSKMKMMFGLMNDVAETYMEHIQGKGTIQTELKDFFARFTNDVIATCACGISVDSYKNRDNELFAIGREAFDFTGIKGLKFFGTSLSPKLMELLHVTMFDKKTESFFRNLTKETIKHREETGLVRPDMLHLLLEARKGKAKDGVSPEINTKKIEITDEDITSQTLIFFFGGLDTVSQSLSNLAYELAVNPEVQDKLIQEIDETLNAGKLTYDALAGMKYMDMVVDETQRMHNQALFLNRKAGKPYTIQPVLPGEKPLYLEKNTDILIPVHCLHTDEKYFQNPEKFDPERFSDDNKKNQVPYTYLPFGTGPRFCIGNRFALLEIKIFAVHLLSKFQIVPTEKTQIPYVISKKAILPVLEGGYWLALEPRQ